MTISKKISSYTLGIVLSLGSVFFALPIDAASLSRLSDIMSNQTASATSSHSIQFITPTGVTASSQTIVVTFPSAFNFTSKTISSLGLTYGTTGTETTATLAASPAAATWGAIFSGTNNSILTLTAPLSGTYIAPGDKVIISYNSTHSINPTSGSYSIGIVAHGDTGSITVPILVDSTMSVSATVAQALSFSISNSSIGFGILTPSNTQYATSTGTGSATEPAFAHTISAGMNGTGGYDITLSGGTLTSGLNSIAAIPGTVATNLTPGSPQFGIRVTTSGGTGTVLAPFNGATGNYGFGTAPLSGQPFATSPGVSPLTVYNVNYAANVSSATPTGSYTTSLTYVITANF